MPRIDCSRILPQPAEALYQLASSVEQYPHFVPWCKSARMLQQQNDFFDAELRVGYGVVQENFVTRVLCTPPQHLQMQLLSGAFKQFAGEWCFTPQTNGFTLVRLCVDFEMKNRLLQMAVGAVFAQATSKIIDAFEQRVRCALPEFKA